MLFSQGSGAKISCLISGGDFGGVAEWLKAAVLKTVRCVSASRVRILPPPMKFSDKENFSGT